MRNSTPGELERGIALFGGITDRGLAGLRLILASGALLIIYLDPAEPNRYVNATYASLCAYTAYSLFIYLLARRSTNFSWRVLELVIWTDVACYSVFILLSNGTNSIFFFFYLFAIVVASSRGGFGSGLAVTLGSLLGIGFSVLGTPLNQIEWNRFLMRTLAIGALGYTLAYWGGAELVLKRKLSLLKELSLIANPRFGVDRTIQRMLSRLLQCYDADYCALILDVDREVQFFRATRQAPDGAPGRSTHLERHAPMPWIPNSGPHTAIYGKHFRPWGRQPSYKAYDPNTHRIVNRPTEEGDAIADSLNVQSFVTAPFQYSRLRGQLLMGSARHNAFDIGDSIFLQQITDQVVPVIDNIRLIDRLASDASEEERRRIARSVHDRVIQPYYGLQIGLHALYEFVRSAESGSHNGNGNGNGNGATSRSVLLLEQLMAMTSEGIEELRAYIHGLKQSQTRQTRLVDSIRRFATRFEKATGIQVSVVDRSTGLGANDRLTAEVFEMTAEALSNVHRHTQTRNAQVTLNLDQNNLILQVDNESSDDPNPIPFSPKSITERVNALGGRTEVFWAAGRTILKVEVPL